MSVNITLDSKYNVNNSTDIDDHHNFYVITQFHGLIVASQSTVFISIILDVLFKHSDYFFCSNFTALALFFRI